MKLIEAILTPFILLIKHILLFGYEITGSYGWAIILLSFIISLLLLPIFIFIEKAKKKNDALKRKMQLHINEIKRVYKGQERYYYLKTLNRQFGYSPLRAMIPILSLLIQIPFFIAAYQYLESFEPLQKVAFGFITDLSKPDGLFGKVHFLPIAMTLVNLITAWFYTRNGDNNERKQMLIIAGVFLVLLFNLPSGLVLYWTMNNVFSFFRLFITNKEVFQGELSTEINKSLSLNSLKNGIISLLPTYKVAFTIIVLVLLSLQLNWALNHSFYMFGLRVAAVLGASFLLAHLLSFVLIKLETSNPKIKTSVIGLLTKEKTGIDFNLLNFNRGYILFLCIALAGSIYTQINWALLKSDFSTIVFRLYTAIISTWLITILTANFAYNIRKNQNISIAKFIHFINTKKQIIIVSLVIMVLFGLGTQLNWALHHSFESFGLRAALILPLAFSITFILITVIYLYNAFSISFNPILYFPQLAYYLWGASLYFILAAVLYYSGKNHSLVFISFIFATLAQTLAYINFFKLPNNYRISKKWLNLLLMPILGMQLLYLLAHLSGGHLLNSLLHNNSNLLYGTLLKTIVNSLAFTSILFAFKKASSIKSLINYNKLKLPYFLSVFFLTGFIFLWNPLEIYSSYPDNFEFPAINIIGKNIHLFLITFAVLAIPFLIIPKRIKFYCLLFILTIASLGLIHNTLLPIDVGTLQEGKFIKQNNLAQPIFIYFFELLYIVLSLVFFKWVIKKQALKQLNFALITLNVVLIIKSLIVSINTGSFINKQQIRMNGTCSISFSKTEQNVVYVIHDMFHGWYVNKILEEEPQLKNDLEGFTWYPNTLSISRITASSIGPLWGGFEYTIDKLNADNTRTMGEKLTEVSEKLYDKVKSKGFNFTANKMIYSKIDPQKFDTYIPVWHDDWDVWNNHLKIGFAKDVRYKMLWKNAAFYTAPLFFKAQIYKNGQWLHAGLTKNENTSRAKKNNAIRVLPYISNTKSENSNFIYLHYKASHQPWDIVDENGKLIYDVSPYENNKWTLLEFTKWINWMKENGVYDNTKIVVISDHGTHWWHNKNKVDRDIPLIENPLLNAEEDATMNLYALMLVKDFKNRGELKTDWRLMSNADAHSILFDENNPTKGEAPVTRTLPSTFVTWDRAIWEKTSLNIRYHFEVTDDAFDLRKWKRIN